MPDVVCHAPLSNVPLPEFLCFDALQNSYIFGMSGLPPPPPPSISVPPKWK